MAAEPLEPRQMLAVDVLAPLADVTLPAGSAQPLALSLSGRFDLAGVTGTVVRVQTNAPGSANAFHVELFDQPGPQRDRTTPATAANFLSYADPGSYDGTIIHRSVPGFVVQGGGFRAPSVPADDPEGFPPPLAQGPSVVNEPGNTNVRGTLAMAKLGNDPNSATNQWFINLANNASNLDFQNGGFTVFGRVLGDGMTVVDVLAAVPTYDATSYYGNGALSDLPLWDVPLDGIVLPENFVTFTHVQRVGELVFQASTDRPDLLGLAVNGTDLVVTPLGATAGTATVTVRAVSVFDPADFAISSFQVALGGRPEIDLDGDGRDDLVWVHEGGVAVGWLLDAAGGIVGSRAFGPGAPWALEALGDFDGDGVSDRLWRNAGNGVVVMELLRGDGSIASAKAIGGDLEWRVESTGDYDGDGKTDIVWRHGPTGINVMWLMNGTTVATAGSVGGDDTWRLVATAASFDSDGDGRTDLVWRHVSGAHVLWRMSGLSVRSTRAIGGDLTWSIVATGDFDGDGRGDLLWRHDSGVVVQWLMDDGALRSARAIGGDAEWSVVNAAGRTIYWRHASGMVVAWGMNGLSIGETRVLGGDQEWSLLRRPGLRV